MSKHGSRKGNDDRSDKKNANNDQYRKDQENRERQRSSPSPTPKKK